MAMKRVSSSGAATTSHFMLAVYNVVICCANFRQVKVSETSSWTRRVTAVSVVWKHGRARRNSSSETACGRFSILLEHRRSVL